MWQQRGIAYLGHEFLVRGDVPKRELRHASELIAHIKAAARGCLSILGQEFVVPVKRILLIVGKNIRRNEPLAFGREWPVILACETVFGSYHDVIAQFGAIG